MRQRRWLVIASAFILVAIVGFVILQRGPLAQPPPPGDASAAGPPADMPPDPGMAGPEGYAGNAKLWPKLPAGRASATE